MAWNTTLANGCRSRWYGYGLMLLAGIFLAMTAVHSAMPLNGFDIEGSLIPEDEIHHGGPQRDGIPALSNPEFITAAEAAWLKPDDRVIGIEIDSERRAYPIRILNYHEIVNDRIADTYFAITYCPLCGTGVAFDAEVAGKAREFGVSGLLYNSDVLLYDRQSESLWSQLMSKAVSGPLKGTLLEKIPILHTSWEAWRKGGDTLVLSLDTGYRRDYSRSPYGNYDEERKLYFPVNTRSTRYHPKERVIGLELEGKFKAYPFVELARVESPLQDSFGGQDLVVVFDVATRSGEIRDSSGKPLPSINSFWFAWYAFHPETDVYEPQGCRARLFSAE
jgi:hypothetical protein